MRIDRIKLISILTKQGIRQREIAEKSGVTKNTISAICNGKSCSRETAEKIAFALGVEVTELLEVRGG